MGTHKIVVNLVSLKDRSFLDFSALTTDVAPSEIAQGGNSQGLPFLIFLSLINLKCKVFSDEIVIWEPVKEHQRPF